MANIDPGPTLGKDCKAFYNSATHATPTWVEITKAINCSFNLAKAEGDLSSRASGWKKSKGGLKDLEYSWTYRWSRGADTVFDALLASYISATPIELWFADGAAADVGTQGPRAFCEVLTMNATQELENGIEYEFTAKPTYKEESSAVVDPDWYEITA